MRAWKSEPILTLLLTARCMRRPLVLLLDEAHMLEREVGRTLLNASRVASSEAPFLLVMTGTPGLHPHLDTMSATFWSRAEKLGIGRLDEAAAFAERATSVREAPLQLCEGAIFTHT